MSVCLFTLSYTNISVASGPMTTKLYPEQDWGRGKAALGLEPDRIRTLDSMANGSSHGVIMGKIVWSL